LIDISKVRQSNNLMEIVGVELRRVASTDGGEYAGPCPFCGGRDRFRVQPESPNGPRWRCHACEDDHWNDVIDFIMRREGMSFADACQYLGAQRSDGNFKPAKPWQPKLNPPSIEWQLRALEVVAEFEQALWTPVGSRALDWLHKRGLQDKTLKAARIGYNERIRYESLEQWGLPAEVDEKTDKPTLVYIARGIVLPGLVRRIPWYIKIRRPDGEPKYLHTKGSRPVLYLSDTLKNHRPMALVEGEFDALLLKQEASETGVATLGSAYNGLTLWQGYLKAARPLLVAYHTDEAGTKHSQKVPRSLPDARLIEIPKLKPNDKDLTDYYLSGGDLRGWIEAQCEKPRSW